MIRGTAGGPTGQVPTLEGRAAEALLRLAVLLVHSGTRDVGLTASLTLAELYWNGPRRLTSLARLQDVSQPSMSGLISSLEREGMVERRRDPVDRRAVVVAVSEKGVRYLEQRRRVAAAHLVDLIGALPEHDRSSLFQAVPILERVVWLDAEDRRPTEG